MPLCACVVVPTVNAQPKVALQVNPFGTHSFVYEQACYCAIVCMRGCAYSQRSAEGCITNEPLRHTIICVRTSLVCRPSLFASCESAFLGRLRGLVLNSARFWERWWCVWLLHTLSSKKKLEEKEKESYGRLYGQTTWSDWTAGKQDSATGIN